LSKNIDIIKMIKLNAWNRPLYVSTKFKPIRTTSIADRDVIAVTFSETTSKFVERIDRETHGKVRMLPFIKQRSPHDIKLMAFIETPPAMTPLRFQGVVTKCWNSTHRTGQIEKIIPASESTLEFLLNTKNKTPYRDLIDWVNCRL
jgi:hypothetical protein